MSTTARKKLERQTKLKAAAREKQREMQLASKIKQKTEFGEYKFPEPFRRTTAEYNSLNSGEYNTYKADDKVYTGTLVKGICQTHKSNAVPIISVQEGIDIARMRR